MGPNKMNQKKVKKNFLIIIAICILGIFLNCPNSIVVGNFSFNKPKIPFINNDLRYGLDLAGGASLMFDIDTQDLDEEVDLNTALESLKANIERRINLFGLAESNVLISSQNEKHRLVVELPGIEDADQAIELIGQTAQLKFKGEVELAPEATASATIYDLFSYDTGLNGSHLTQSSVVLNHQTGKPEVQLVFDQEGQKLFEQATKDFLGKKLAIFLDDYLVSAPVINSVITDNTAVIQGNFDNESAKYLSTQLNAGALPLSISLSHQNQIGATLGQNSIEKGIFAGAIGLLAVCLFMIIIYGYLGFIATLSLIIYGLITVSLYRLLSVTLTFPGIVGLILSIGMAVDSNILIFERIKEEKLRGKDWLSAVSIGFDRAWTSIKDANTCTIITGLILINPLNWNFLNSSGMVRGFAVTLLLGIFVGIFSSIFITKNILLTFIPEDKEQK